jgi:predicted Zn-dependent protease
LLIKRIFSAFTLILQLSFLLLNPKTILAASIIRDAEIEKFLRDIEVPIFKAANLNINQLKIYIINDNEVNAFVSAGQNIFINIGLIRIYHSCDALIGVLAHETGHIAAGHLARNSEEAATIEKAMIINYLLGIGAMLAGQYEVGEATILGGSQTYLRLFMKYSRAQEEAADKLALNYLDKLQYPADGLLKLLQFFDSKQIGLRNNIDEFALSHPISKKRIDFIKHHTQLAKYNNQKINLLLQPSMQWVLIKLEAFSDDLNQVIQKYKNFKDSDLKFYALAIANYRLGNVALAINNIDKVILNNPYNGFLYELKAQFILAAGDLVNAILNYNQALKLIDEENSVLIKLALSNSIIALENNDLDLLKLAIKYLKEASKQEDDNLLVFRSLAIAYKKLNDQGRSYLALADYNLIAGNYGEAIKFANLAKKNLNNDAKSDLLHCDDILKITDK